MLYQQKHSPSDVQHYHTSSPCSALDPCPVNGNNVTTDDWAQFNGDGSSCGTNCNYTGCVRGTECALTATCVAVVTGSKYCNLCYDRECATCSTYDDI